MLGAYASINLNKRRKKTMMLDKENVYKFSVKMGRSEVSIPFETVLAVLGGIFFLKFIKIMVQKF
jgi:hypothetical protein